MLGDDCPNTYIYVVQAYKESAHTVVVGNQTDSYIVSVGWISLHFQNIQIEHIWPSMAPCAH